MGIRCLAASAAEAFPWCRTPGKDVVVGRKTIARDVGFFLVFFAAASAAGVVELPPLARIGLDAVLVAAYAYYVRLTLHSGGALEEVPERLTLWRFGSCWGSQITRSALDEFLRDHL